MKIILAVILGIWLLGFLLRIAGGFIHILLVLALIIFLMDFFTNKT